MLRTNLSTRPFYNERAIHWGLGLALAAIVALTAFNVTRVLALSQEQSALASKAEYDEAQARRLQGEAAKLRASIDQKALEQVIHAAREANQIIDERTFSWTELLNQIERTLPAGVMLTSIAPKVDKDGFFVQMVVNGRSVEAVDEFIEKLEATHAFTGVSPNTEHIIEGGLYEVLLVSAYQPSAAASAPASGDKASERDAAEGEAPEDGAPRDGASKEGAAKDGAAKGHAPDATTPSAATPPATPRPPATTKPTVTPPRTSTSAARGASIPRAAAEKRVAP